MASLALRIVIFLIAAASCAGCATGRAHERVVSSAPPGREASSAETGGVVVDVAGAVHRPGVYRMPAGARVHEAIEAAGGVVAGASMAALNRAAPLVDGQQVLIGTDPQGGSDATTVSLNASDETQLQQLPGIGPVTAAKIVAEREAGGPFASVDDLDRVPGIGPATIESLRDVATA